MPLLLSATAPIKGWFYWGFFPDGLGEARKIYRKFVLRDNILEGAILLGNIRENEEIQKAIKSKKDISPFKNLADEQFDSGELK